MDPKTFKLECSAVQRSMRCCKVADLHTLHVQEQAVAMPFHHLTTTGALQIYDS